MRRRFLTIAVLVAGVVPAVALAAGAAMHPHVTATLSGIAEVPRGAPNGSGRATVDLDAAAGKVCWKFTKLKNLGGKPSAAHIHRGKAGVAGPVVVPLGGAFKAQGCITGISKSLIEQIEASPGRYYVNVHNSRYPAGAVRGQLKAGPA